MELEITCPSCGKSFDVKHDGASGVVDCAHCGATIKFGDRHRDQIHHLPSHANLHVSHKTMPAEEAPKPRGSLMEMAVWFVVIVMGVGLVWWWLSRPPPPEEPKIWKPEDASSQLPPSQPATELVEIALSNPGFEKMLEGWRIMQTAGLVRVMTEAAHSGNRGLRVADDSAERESAVSYSFPLVPGDKYECRFWARVVSGKGVTVSVRFSNAEGAALENSMEVPADTKQWKEFAVTAKAPKLAVKGEIWIATSEQGTAVVDFDDFRLRKFK